MIELPEGWTSHKTLKLVEIDLIEDPLYFDEDMFYLKSPDGRFMLDVGWYGGDVKAGSYKCYLIEVRPDLSEEEYHPWDDALEIFATRKTSEVFQWLSKTLSTVHAKHYARTHAAADPESFLFQHYEGSMLDHPRSRDGSWSLGAHNEYVIVNDISDEVALILKTQFKKKHP